MSSHRTALLASAAIVLAMLPGQMALAQGTQAAPVTPATPDSQANQVTTGDSAAEVATPADGTSGTDTEIVVTGSRIARPEFSSPNPVESFTSATIEQSGDTNLTDFLIDTPALAGSLSNERNAGSNAGAGTVGLNLLDLRNLGTERTLVLVNGRRHVNSYPGENSVDINTIPTDLVDRVDILTGGASAVYGADAVSGVVNFVLKRDFEGIRARGQIGISQRGDAGNRYGSITAGKNFADGRGNVAISYEYNESSRFSQDQRAFLGDPRQRYELLQDPDDFSPDDPNRYDYQLYNNVSWSDSARNGAVDVTLDGVPDFDGDGRPYDGGSYLPGSGGRAINSSSNTPTAGYFGDLTPYIRRHNVNALASFEVSPALRFYGEGKYFHSNSFTEIQPSFDFYTYLAPDNYYLQQYGAAHGIDVSQGALLSRDNFDLGRGGQSASRETIRGVLGAEGKLTEGEGSGNLHYDASFVFGRSSSKTTDVNQRLYDRYYAALDAVTDPTTGGPTCRINLPGETIIDPNNYAGIAEITGVPVSGMPLTFSPGQCSPLNLLGENQLTQAARDFVNVNDVTRARNDQYVGNVTLTGDLGFLFDLPGGPIGFAIGAEYRRESTRSTPSAYSQLGAFEGGLQVAPSGGHYDVKEAFGEVNLPILSKVRFADTLSVGGAVRFSDYSTIGRTTTWKVDGAYAPIRDLTFRGTYSQAVRAPNITELFSPDQGTFEFLDDPCDPSNIGEGSQYREANCRTQLEAAGLSPAEIAAFSPATDAEQSTSRPGVTGGNRNLREETAKTWTAGLVLRPQFLRGFTISADWYDIKIKNAINTPTANDTFKNCVDAPTLDNAFCPLFTRSSGTGFIGSYQVRAQNVAQFTTSGLDLVANYQFSPSATLGTFNVRVVGGYLHDLTFIPGAGADPDQDVKEAYSPHFLGTADLTWSKGGLTLNYGLSWQSHTRFFTTEELRANPDKSDPKYFYYKQRWEHDIRASYDVDEQFEVFGGINNFTDQKPTRWALDSYPVSSIGRYFYAGATVKLADLF